MESELHPCTCNTENPESCKSNIHYCVCITKENCRAYKSDCVCICKYMNNDNYNTINCKSINHGCIYLKGLRFTVLCKYSEFTSPMCKCICKKFPNHTSFCKSPKHSCVCDEVGRSKCRFDASIYNHTNGHNCSCNFTEINRFTHKIYCESHEHECICHKDHKLCMSEYHKCMCKINPKLCNDKKNHKLYRFENHKCICNINPLSCVFKPTQLNNKHNNNSFALKMFIIKLSNYQEELVNKIIQFLNPEQIQYTIRLTPNLSLSNDYRSSDEESSDEEN